MEIRKSIIMILVLTMGLGVAAQVAGSPAGCDEEPCVDQITLGCDHASVDWLIVKSEKCCTVPQQTPCDLEEDQASNSSEFVLRSSRKLPYKDLGVIRAARSVPTINHSSQGFDPKLWIGLQLEKPTIYLKNLSLII